MKKIKHLCFSIYLSLFVANLADFQACHGVQQGSVICAIFVFGLSATGATFLHNKTKARKFVYAGQIEISERTEREAKKHRFMNFGKWFCVGAAISSVIFMILSDKKVKPENGDRLPSQPEDLSLSENQDPPSPAPKHVICRPRQNSWPIASPVRENSVDESTSPSLSPDPRFGLKRPPSMESDSQSRSRSLP